MRALRRRGEVERLPAALPTSPRRFEEEGRGWAWFRNTVVMLLAFLGSSPERLSGLYPARGSTGPAGRITLAFAKAPTPGKVKTRLAAGLGIHAAAANLYATMARDTMDRLRSTAYELYACYDPPSSASQVQACWARTLRSHRNRTATSVIVSGARCATGLKSRAKCVWLAPTSPDSTRPWWKKRSKSYRKRTW